MSGFISSKESIPQDQELYDKHVEALREHEYPSLNNATYLDHAGTTRYSRTFMERFQTDMMGSLYGNPHAASGSSQKSTLEIERVRLQLLQYFHADPDEFDLVFTANSTAAIKLVGDAFREQEGGFWYGYHADSHTSLVGLRELARENECFVSDEHAENRINKLGLERNQRTKLFAYPAQSNMNGRRLPLKWCQDVRAKCIDEASYTLLDAAALVTTSPLDLSDSSIAPDFTVLSLYKIYGFPDMGALIIKKDSGHVFERRKYFGGGTVDMVACLGERWHARKSGPLHERLEDGTLPVHSIIALKHALRTHEGLFESIERVSKHTSVLAKELYEGLVPLRHDNGEPVCAIYKHSESNYGDTETQGPVIAFNFRDSRGRWVSNTEVEKLASVRDIHLRTGGVCNPGGVGNALGLAPWELRENFSSGHRCASENDILNGKPTGVIRLSLGAMSTRSDVERFLSFTQEFFVDKKCPPAFVPMDTRTAASPQYHVESLTVYPIKSCGGYEVPVATSWAVNKHGLAWDREWCLIHRGTGKVLSQKQHPRMALIRPALNLKDGVLRVTAVGTKGDSIEIPLSKDPALFESPTLTRNANVCGDEIDFLTYARPEIADFFFRVLSVPCRLARRDPTSASGRHSKLHLQMARQNEGTKTPQIYLSNESPILTISRSSLDRLNEQVKAKGGKAVHSSLFRANIVVSQSPKQNQNSELAQPWAEDQWNGMRIGGEHGPMFDFWGGCSRCQMVSIDQHSAERNSEPFVTLAKTRRFDGKVLFGVHGMLADAQARSQGIAPGDDVEPCVSVLEAG